MTGLPNRSRFNILHLEGMEKYFALGLRSYGVSRSIVTLLVGYWGCYRTGKVAEQVTVYYLTFRRDGKMFQLWASFLRRPNRKGCIWMPSVRKLWHASTSPSRVNSVNTKTIITNLFWTDFRNLNLV